MQWLQDPNKSTVGNGNNIRCEASRHFRKKKKGYMEAKINELETDINIFTVVHFATVLHTAYLCIM